MSIYKVLCSCLEAGSFRQPVKHYIIALTLAVIADDGEYPARQARAQRWENDLTAAEIEAARQLADIMLAEVAARQLPDIMLAEVRDAR